MSKTKRCSFCRELFDSSEYPDLQTSKMNCCHPCWEILNDYLIQRHFGLMQMKDETEQGK
jgi:hypothetical protein